ncbi:MAG: 6,7-dimethyl-8-ribityllumazine synthase [Patescibacteria group bacterium]
MKFAIIQALFNKEITDGLLKGAARAFKENKVPQKNLKIVQVPGAWEIPVMAENLARTKKYQAIICLGAVIKGQTTHDYWICQAVFPALQELTIKYNLPITLGIITCQNWKQAQARSKNNKENRGYVAAKAAMEMMKLLRN